jgi:hypothetical protein
MQSRDSDSPVGRALTLGQSCVGNACVRTRLRICVVLGAVLLAVLVGLTSVARGDFAQPSRSAVLGARPHSPGSQPGGQTIGPLAPASSSVRAGSVATEALVAGAPPIPPGQTDNVVDNSKYEPTIARDPVTGHFLASAIDFVVFDYFFNSGDSAVYMSPDAVDWSHPSFAAGTSPDCQWSSDILPGYCDLGFYSAGDVTAAFGPRPDGAGGFSFANGARAYISNDFRSVFLPLGPGIAVSHSDDDGASWAAPAVLATPNASIDSDKSVVWADADPQSPCFGTVYDAWTQFLDPNTPQEHGPVELSRSTDGGNGFTAPLMITAAGSTDDTAVGGIVSLRDGTVAVAWGSYGNSATENGTGPVTIDVALSHDCGRTFAPPVFAARASEGHGVSVFYRVPGTRFRVATIPSIATDGEHLYIAWSETDPSSGELVVRAAHSPHGGASWRAPDTVSDPTAGEAFMPAIGTTGNRVIVSYANVTASSTTPGPGVASVRMLYAVGNPADNQFVRHQLSSQGGDPDGTFFPADTFNFIGDYTSITTSGQGAQARAYPIWTDDRDSQPCAQWDAYLAAVDAGQNPPFPDIDHVCPAGFGASEIWSGTIPTR